MLQDRRVAVGEARERPAYRFILLLVAAIALLLPVPASAHGASPAGTPQTIVQGIGPYELAVTMQVPKTLPAPLAVQIAPEQQFGEAVTVALWVVPVGAPLPMPPTAQMVVTDATLAPAPTQIPLNHPGDYELALRVSGSRGGGEARLPLTAVTPPVSWVVVVMLGALGMFLAIIGGALGVRIVMHRRRLPFPARTQPLLTGAMTGCIVIALGAFLATQFMPLGAATPATNAALYGRSYVNVTLHTDAPDTRVGQPMQITLDVTDGGTGLPVDDLVPDHNALMHFVVMSADRGFFRHIHPARTAPGHYLTTITPDRPGDYTAYVEVMRQDSGTQVIARRFTVGGMATDAQAGAAPGVGTRGMGDLSVAVTASHPIIRAGEQVVLAFTFTAGGHAVPLAPYLGMAGHLLATNSESTVFGHVHATDLAQATPPSGGFTGGFAVLTTAPPTPAPLAPTVHFAYTFPESGHYTVWAQVKRADTNRVVTVPLSLDIAPAGGAP